MDRYITRAAQRPEICHVCVRISDISLPISKIQRPGCRARQDDSNEPSHILTAPIKTSVALQTLADDMLRTLKIERARANIFTP